MITLKPSLFALDTVDDLRTSLQSAIELEHATIPPYLYAVFSLQPDPDPVNPKPNPNADVQALISSVVAEEMAHMALACNILNAIGGAPVIDKPDFVPKYPGPLPGGVEADLRVPLEPFSIDLCRDVFMCIEEPELGGIPFGLQAAPTQTIGAFYNAISERIGAEGESIFTGHRDLQVSGTPAVPEVIPVFTVEDAQQAINVIVEQGEGTSTTPLDLEGQYAHYYRFAEIANGKQLEPVENPPPNPEPKDLYSFTGPDIPFDASAVLPLVPNPSRADYRAGSQQLQACDSFNYTYTTLLKSLHDTFNGHPDRLGPAVGIMESMWEQALYMIQLDSGNGDGKRCGPSFQYQPVNPSAA
jgi:hypothetical protein